MWHSDKSPTPEELEVLKELEYDLFMYNPGFRSMWNNDFDEYFKALFDEEKWENKIKERMDNSQEGISIKMIKNPGFAKFMQEQAIIDDVLLGDMKIEHAPIQLQQEIRQIIKESKQMNEEFELREKLGVPWEDIQEPWEKDSLYKMAFEWAETVNKKLFAYYEQTKNIDSFRILNNCGLVSSKIVCALTEVDNDQMDFEWRIDRVDYTLSLTSLKRCVESLKKLAKIAEGQFKADVENFLVTAGKIAIELTNRLENIYKKILTESSKIDKK